MLHRFKHYLHYLHFAASCGIDRYSHVIAKLWKAFKRSTNHRVQNVRIRENAWHDLYRLYVIKFTPSCASKWALSFINIFTGGNAITQIVYTFLRHFTCFLPHRERSFWDLVISRRIWNGQFWLKTDRSYHRIILLLLLFIEIFTKIRIARINKT